MSDNNNDKESEESKTQKRDESETEVFRMKNLLKKLSSLQGTAGSSSVITLIVRAGEQISKSSALLTNEYGTAGNIKSRVTRSSVLDALSSAQQKLKLYTRTPSNGLIVLCGNVEIQTQGGSREKRLAISFEPPKPMKDSLYRCDNRFHLETILSSLDGDGSQTGVVIISGEGALFAILEDDEVRVLSEFQVDLPKKHGRGGQSKLRFERLAQEARDNFIKKAAEVANRMYISQNRVSIQKLLLAGNHSHKRFLSQSSILDYRLKNILIGGRDTPTLIDTAYGFRRGLQEVMNTMKELIRGTKLEVERDEISSFYEAISMDKKDLCYGLKHTLYAMDEKLLSKIYVSKMHTTQIALESTDEGVREELREIAAVSGSIDTASISLIDYVISYGKRYGVKVVLISNALAQGEQFLSGFGGIAGRLRYEVDLSALVNPEDEVVEDNDNDDVYWD